MYVDCNNVLCGGGTNDETNQNKGETEVTNDEVGTNDETTNANCVFKYEDIGVKEIEQITKDDNYKH